MTDFAQFSSPAKVLRSSVDCREQVRIRLNNAELSPTVRQWRTDGDHGVPMGSIVSRKRKDGSTGYRAQIVRKKDGEEVWRESQTFDRRAAAAAWLARREAELAEPGAMDRKEDPPLADVIDRYVAESNRAIGRTKAQVLRTIKAMPIAELRCSEIGSADLTAFARSLPVSPSTVQNYMSHLAAIFSLARPAWGYPLDQQAMRDACTVTKRLGITAKSRARDRRPTLDELDRLIEHFEAIRAARPKSAPMRKIICFAIFSTRRQEEITRITWADYDKTRVMVRDMKHPGDKQGNDTWCELVPEAAAFIESMPKIDSRIFPFSADAISAAFTRACKATGINTDEMPDEERLHFHDLRHEGISRLFEMEWGGGSIPKVAAVSGHRSWKSLQRYSHIRQSGDKYKNWKWATP